MKFTRQWSIAKKLNTAQAILLTALLLVATTLTTVWLSNILEEKSITAIKRANQQALDLIDSYDTVLEHSVEKLGTVLQSYFPAGFILDPGSRVEVNGASTPALKSAGQSLNANYESVDRFTGVTGAVATVFVRQGEDFVRIATSIRKENGERAVGTPLGASHPALASLLRGESFTGKARLFGRDYMARYIPQQDKTGQIVGVLFVGLDFTTELVALKEKLKSVRFGHSGYIFAVDAGKDAGTFTIHPNLEGKNLLDARDPDGKAYIQEIVQQKNGQLEYQFINPTLNDKTPQAKIAIFAHYPKWDWVIASSCYLDELSEEAWAVHIRLFFAGLLLSAIMALVTSRSLLVWVTRPLNKAVQSMQEIAQGNLSTRIPRYKSNDEVGQLLNATRRMAESMAEALADIQNASHRLTDSAHQLSQASQHVATQSSQQSEAAASMAASIEEMEASIRHVRDCATDARDLAQHAGTSSAEGAGIIDQAVRSIAQIAATVREASGSVSRLGQESAAIAEIVSTIKGIADQTNLLALNAAIEAARAGEAGRGFAVVADEVKKLAQSTSASTQEIEGMISKILAGTQSAVSSIETGVEQVEQGVKLAAQAGTSIAAIRENANQVSKAVSSISLALSEQSAASGELSKNVVSVAGTADQNASMAQSSAKNAGSLEDLAACLNRQLARFNLGQRDNLPLLPKHQAQ